MLGVVRGQLEQNFPALLRGRGQAVQDGYGLTVHLDDPRSRHALSWRSHWPPSQRARASSASRASV